MTPKSTISAYRFSYDAYTKSMKLIDYEGEKLEDGWKYIMVKLGDALILSQREEGVESLDQTVLELLKKKENNRDK